MDICNLGNRDDIASSVCGVLNGYKFLFPRRLLPLILSIHPLTLYSERQHQHCL